MKKHQTHMSDEIERKILSMFGLGMSYLDIAGHIAEIYGLEVSNVGDVHKPSRVQLDAGLKAQGMRLSICLAGW